MQVAEAKRQKELKENEKKEAERKKKEEAARKEAEKQAAIARAKQEAEERARVGFCLFLKEMAYKRVFLDALCVY